jgi:hypothetical protein
MSDEADELDECAYLWDGSEPGWVLLKAPKLESGYSIFNRLRSVAMLVEDEALNTRLCERMKEAGCEVLDRLPSGL